MSNVGRPVGPSSDPWEGRPAEGTPRDPRRSPGYGGQPGGWGEKPTDHRYAPPAPPYDPPTQQYPPPTQQYEPPAQRDEPSAGWNAGQPTHPAFPPVAPDQGGPDQGGPDQGGPDQGGPDQGGPDQGGPDQGGPPYRGLARPKRGRGPLVAVLAVVAVLLLGGATALWLFGRDPAAPVSDPAPVTAEPSAEATQPATKAPTRPASSSDPRFVRAGQCVRNDGGTTEPKLVITECAPQTYEVLRRIDGPTSGKGDAETKCAKVDGYTDWFFFDSELDALDYVLCLKER